MAASRKNNTIKHGGVLKTQIIPKPIEAFQTPEDMVTDLLKQNSNGILNKRIQEFCGIHCERKSI